MSILVLVCFFYSVKLSGLTLTSGNFLYNNYRQALGIISDGEINLKKLMQDMHIPDEAVFEQWLEDERDYLHGLRSEPEHETLQMEYWQKLVNLAASQ